LCGQYVWVYSLPEPTAPRKGSVGRGSGAAAADETPRGAWVSNVAIADVIGVDEGNCSQPVRSGPAVTNFMGARKVRYGVGSRVCARECPGPRIGRVSARSTPLARGDARPRNCADDLFVGVTEKSGGRPSRRCYNSGHRNPVANFVAATKVAASGPRWARHALIGLTMGALPREQRNSPKRSTVTGMTLQRTFPEPGKFLAACMVLSPMQARDEATPTAPATWPEATGTSESLNHRPAQPGEFCGRPAKLPSGPKSRPDGCCRMLRQPGHIGVVQRQWGEPDTPHRAASGTGGRAET
jgi:hypothetical protein